MTQLSEEQEERVKQIREKLTKGQVFQWDYTPDVDFLSDSQAAGDGHELAKQIVSSCLCAEPSHNCQESAAMHVCAEEGIEVAD